MRNQTPLTPSVLAATAVAAILVAAALYSSPALAKANPVRIEPPADAVLTEAPGLVEMWFSQPLTPGTDATSVTLRRQGSSTEIHPLYAAVAAADPTHLVFSPPPNLTAGRYIVSWRATSAQDGQVSQGEYAFTIDPSATPTGRGEGGSGPDLLKTILITLAGVAGGTFLGLLAYLFRRSIGFDWHRPPEGGGGGEQH